MKKEVFFSIILPTYNREKKVLKGHILDFFTTDKNDVKMNLIFFCMNFFKRKKVNLIDLFVKGDKKLENIFLKQKFKINKKIPLVCKYNENIDKNKKFFNRTKWFMTQGDSFEIY